MDSLARAPWVRLEVGGCEKPLKGFDPRGPWYTSINGGVNEREHGEQSVFARTFNRARPPQVESGSAPERRIYAAER